MPTNIKKFAIETVKEAGKIILNDFRKIREKDIFTKAHRELVTKTDLKSEKYIISAIRKKFPNHSILSEESGLIDKKSDYVWLIDPLDGTTNFTIGNPLFSVSTALIHKKDIIFGAGYAPFLKELYFAEKGQGAYLNGKRIKVSKKDKIKKSILLFCHGHRRKDYKKVIKIYGAFKLQCQSLRQLGSAFLELGFVAAGRCESIMIGGLRTWDLAAGALLVREAGGKVTDFAGREWSLSSKNILATNSKIHNEILNKLRRIK